MQKRWSSDIKIGVFEELLVVPKQRKCNILDVRNIAFTTVNSRPHTVPYLTQKQYTCNNGLNCILQTKHSFGSITVITFGKPLHNREQMTSELRKSLEACFSIPQKDQRTHQI